MLGNLGESYLRVSHVKVFDRLLAGVDRARSVALSHDRV